MQSKIKSIIVGLFVLGTLGVTGVTFVPSQTVYADTTSDLANCQKITDQAQKNGCVTGVVCASSLGQPGVAETPCQQAVTTCLNSGKTGTDLQSCMDQAPSADKTTTQSASTAATTTPATGTCGKAQTVVVQCNSGSSTAQDVIKDVLKQGLLIMTALVGIMAVGGIIYGAILYASARDNSSQTQQAIGIIRNTAIGILLYIFMTAILNWLVPGGVL